MSSVISLINCQVLLVAFFTYSIADYADLHLCDLTSLQVKAGDTMQICCELGENDCMSSSSNDTMIIKKSVDESIYNLTRVSQCSVMLSISNANEEDSGVYMCFWNNAEIAQGIQRFFVIGKPLALTILSTTVLPLRSSYKMIVRFAIAELHDISTKYEVWMDRGPSNYGLPRQVLLCANATCDASTFLCHCEYESEISYQVGDWTYTLEVRLIRGIQRVYSNTTIVFVKHFQPGVVRNMNVIHTSSESAVVKFCVPAGFQRLVEFMHLHSVPLRFRLNLQKLQGKHQKIMVTVPSPIVTESPMCIEVTFDDLIPFTKYKIIIVAEGPGGNSSERSFFFTTHIAVPKRAPRIQPFDFAHGRDENGVTAVYVQWEPLDADSKGGNVEYVVLAMSFGEEKLAENVTDQNTMVFYNLTSGLSSIRVWALNEKGYSDDYAEISIKPSVPVYQQPQMQVELRQDVARVVFDKNCVKGEDMVLLWCPGYRLYSFHLDICEEYPLSEFKSCPDQEVDLELSGHHSDDLEESNTTLRNVSYVYTQNKSNNRRSEPMNVTSEIIMGHNTLLSPNVTANFSTPGDDDDSDNGIGGSGDGQMESSNDESWTISGLGSQGRELRILIALKRGKHWTGLFPADCYFDGDGDVVKLIFSADYESNNKVKLGIKQDCKPQYFLAYSFRVYSTHGDCFPQPDKSEVQTILNRYFERSFLYLDKKGTAVCAIAEGWKGKQSPPVIKFFDDINEKTDDKIPWDVILPCLLAMGIATCLGICIFIRLRRSKKYVKRLAATSDIFVLTGGENKDTASFKMKESDSALVNDQEQLVRFQKEVTELSDSGLGSMSLKRLSSVYDQDQELPTSLESVLENDEEAEDRPHQLAKADIEGCENTHIESSDIRHLEPSQKDLIENEGFEFKPTSEESDDENVVCADFCASKPEDSERNFNLESKVLVEEKILNIGPLLSDGANWDVRKVCLTEPLIERGSSNLIVGTDSNVGVPSENSPVAFVDSEKSREQGLKVVDKGVFSESLCDSGQGIETSSADGDQIKLVNESGFSFIPFERMSSETVV